MKDKDKKKIKIVRVSRLVLSGFTFLPSSSTKSYFHLLFYYIFVTFSTVFYRFVKVRLALQLSSPPPSSPFLFFWVGYVPSVWTRTALVVFSASVRTALIINAPYGQG